MKTIRLISALALTALLMCSCGGKKQQNIIDLPREATPPAIQAAVDAAPADGTETTITMIDNSVIEVDGTGVIIPAGKNVVLDLSCNSGGSADTAVYTLAAFLGRTNLSIQDSFTGAFVTSKGEWSFLYNKDADPNAFHDAFNKAAENNGAGFAQEMMIHQGVQVKTTRPLSNVNLFRAVCEKDNKLCIVDAKESGSFGSFITALLNAGVTEAIYTDMGYGWNYSWYRKDDGTVKELFPTPGKYTTNWITFYE